MVKRFIGSIGLLLIFLAAGIAVQAHPSNAPALATVPSSTPASPGATAPVWIGDSGTLNTNRLVALDPASGALLAGIDPASYNAIMSSDGRWRYSVDITLQNGNDYLELTTIDLQRGAITRVVPLGDWTLLMPSSPNDLSMQLALSRDNHLLAVTLTSKLDTRWYSDVFLYDTVNDKSLLNLPIQVFNDDRADMPLVQTIVSADGQRVFVVENRSRAPTQSEGSQPFWSTEIAVVNVTTQQVEKTIAVPGEIQADGFWMNGVLASDGRTLYLIENIVRGNDSAGYRFVALDTSRLQVTLSHLVDTTAGGQDFGIGAPGLRFTPDGQFLIGFTSRKGGAGNYDYFFQFLDTRSGKVAEVQLQRTVQGANFDPIYTVASSDGNLLYLIFAQTHEIIAFDLTQRVVVKRTVLQDSQSALPTTLDRLAQLVVTSASAKFYAQPSAILSPDGHRLYFVDVKDIDSGDGFWAVDTSTFKPLGHWLRGKEVSGLQLSGDGSELYALGVKDHTLYVLDPLTGAVRRAFDQNLSQPTGFLTAEGT